MSKYTILKTNRFLKDYKKMQKRNNFDEMKKPLYSNSCYKYLEHDPMNMRGLSV